MKISKYGIILSRLEEKDLELLREKRNAEHIQRYMEYREYITPEKQVEWFHRVNNNKNLYFIINYDGKARGLINSKNIEWNPLRSEAGLFIWDQNLWNTQIPAFSTLILLEIAFFVDKAEYSLCQVLSDNPKAQKFNKQLGYELLPDQENIYNQYYKLTRDRFFRKTAKIIKAAETVSEEKDKTLSIFFSQPDFNSGIAELLINNANKETIAERLKGIDGETITFYSIT